MYYTKELKYIHLTYSDKDLEYFNELIDQFDLMSEEIVSFFNLENFGSKVNVKLFDLLKDFRTAIKPFGVPTDRKGKVAPWVCGIAQDEGILTLCLKEYRKTKGHRKETVEGLIHLVLHEFVHACHMKAAGKINCYVWLSEGMATALSHQNDGEKMRFHASLEEMMTGNGNYNSCCTMFEYVYKKYGKEFILDLIHNNEEVIKKTPDLYEEVKHFYSVV